MINKTVIAKTGAGVSAASGALYVFAPKCPMCLTAYVTPIGIACLSGLAAVMTITKVVKLKNASKKDSADEKDASAF